MYREYILELADVPPECPNCKQNKPISKKKKKKKKLFSKEPKEKNDSDVKTLFHVSSSSSDHLVPVGTNYVPRERPPRYNINTCNCGKPRLCAQDKPGRNQGRLFYKCKKCNWFEWATHSVDSSGRYLV
jgi:hypothetical protein